MAHQIIRQPDGAYAVWSTVVDDFVMFDASVEDIIEDWVETARERMTEDVRRIVNELDTGGKPYHQFTKTWDDAIQKIREVHGASSETWSILSELGLLNGAASGAKQSASGETEHQNAE